MNINLKSTTTILVLVSIVVSLISGLGTNINPVHGWFFSEQTTGMPEILHGQVWRLITPIFLHFGVLHILFNCLAMWQLGKAIETHHSTLTYVMMVIVMSSLSNFTQYLVTGPAFGGLSGLLYGLFGYIWIRGWRDPSTPYRLSRFDTILMIVWFGLCWTGLLGHIANYAHTAGLVAGMCWAFIATIDTSRSYANLSADNTEL